MDAGISPPFSMMLLEQRSLPGPGKDGCPCHELGVLGACRAKGARIAWPHGTWDGSSSRWQWGGRVHARRSSVTVLRAAAVSHWTRRTITPPTPYRTHPSIDGAGRDEPDDRAQTNRHSTAVDHVVFDRLEGLDDHLSQVCFSGSPRSSFGSARECPAGRSGILTYTQDKHLPYNTQ